MNFSVKPRNFPTYDMKLFLKLIFSLFTLHLMMCFAEGSQPGGHWLLKIKLDFVSHIVPKDQFGIFPNSVLAL